MFLIVNPFRDCIEARREENIWLKDFFFFVAPPPTHIPVFFRVCGLAAHCLFSEVAHFWNSLHCGIYYWLLHGCYWHKRSTVDAVSQNW